MSWTCLWAIQRLNSGSENYTYVKLHEISKIEDAKFSPGDDDFRKSGEVFSWGGNKHRVAN